VAARPDFLARRENAAGLLLSPEVRYERLVVEDYLALPSSLSEPAAWFNSIAAQREAVCAGLGWGLFPRYAIEREVARGELAIADIPVTPEQFGIWVRRDDNEALPLASRLTDWLKRRGRL
jgi:DNA-binding transcriptional LysR family regulator